MSRARIPALAALLCAAAGGTRAATTAATAPALARTEAALHAAADRLALVEREYGTGEDPSELIEQRRRFADGETQYLLGETANAAALLYDVVDSPAFRAEESYPDALDYLADSLYRQQSWLEARRYYRELLERKVPRYEQEALLRLIELSDKTNDWSGIEENYKVLVAQGGALRPEVVYFHAKWVARRPDVSANERITQGLAAFSGIPDTSEYGPQARYFEGSLLVQRGALEDAVKSFEHVLAMPQVVAAPAPAELARRAEEPGVRPQGAAAAEAQRAARASKVRDLSLLALGRILFEQGKYGLAIDRYEEIARESDTYYNDALYELSASWLKLGEYAKALRAVDLLLLLVEDSPIAPEARLLEASLYLRLKKYAKAMEQFSAISDQYRPVHERIAALTNREDPVSYYDELLASGEKGLDTTQLLPEVARKYVSGRDVAQARGIIDELAAGRQGIEQSTEILARLDAAVEQGKLDLFPTLQEGNQRAVEVENSLLRVDAELAAEQGALIDREAPTLTAAFAATHQERSALDAQLADLPSSTAESDERKQQYLARVAEVEKGAYRLGVEVEGLEAELSAAERWQRETRSKRAAPALAETELAAQIERDRAMVAALEKARRELLRGLEVLRAEAPSAASGGAGADLLRAAYLLAVQKESQAAQATQAVLSAEGKSAFAQMLADAAKVRDLRSRVQHIRRDIRERAGRKLASLRARIEREASTVRGYTAAALGAEGGTKQLLGRIAFQSFARVERQFYDLVLKADVGVIDAAWTQKKDRTEAITQLENEKLSGLRVLQDEFQEVLKEVE